MESQERKVDTSHVLSMERNLKTAISENAACLAEKADRQALDAVREGHHLELQKLSSQLQAFSHGLSRLDHRVCCHMPGLFFMPWPPSGIPRDTAERNKHGTQLPSSNFTFNT
jgi:hypothetical protein